MVDEKQNDSKKLEPKAKDAFLGRFVIKQGGKVVSEIERDNYTVQAPDGTVVSRGERPAIIAELKKRFPKAAFVWVG